MEDNDLFLTHIVKHKKMAEDDEAYGLSLDAVQLKATVYLEAPLLYKVDPNTPSNEWKLEGVVSRTDFESHVDKLVGFKNQIQTPYFTEDGTPYTISIVLERKDVNGPSDPSTESSDNRS